MVRELGIFQYVQLLLVPVLCSYSALCCDYSKDGLLGVVLKGERNERLIVSETRQPRHCHLLYAE